MFISHTKKKSLQYTCTCTVMTIQGKYQNITHYNKRGWAL